MAPGRPLGFMQNVSDKIRLPYADGTKESEGEDEGSLANKRTWINWLASGSQGVCSCSSSTIAFESYALFAILFIRKAMYSPFKGC